MSQQPARGTTYDRQVRFGRILGLVFLAAGFGVLAFGYHGTAKNAFIDKQIPYLISGGASGLALVILGVGLLVLAQFRNERLKLGEQLEQLGSTLTKASVGAAVASGVVSTNGLVVAGRSTYHRPDCRLVEGKADLERVPVEVARTNGLSPCRVCSPDEAGGAPSAPARRKRASAKSSSRRRS